MPTPRHLKPPVAAWIAGERHRLGWKPKDVVDRLAAGGVEVTEQTIRVWESNSDRRPSPYNLEALERIFDSRAPEPTSPPADLGALVGAIDRLVEEMRLTRLEQREWTEGVTEAVAALAGGQPPAAPTADREPARRAGARQ